MELNTVLNDAFEFHKKLKQTQEYVQYKIIEEKFLTDKNLSSIFFDYQNIKNEYEVTNNQELLKELYELKIVIDSNNLVKEYKDAYNKLNVKLNEIKNIIFQDLTFKDDIFTAFKMSKDTLK